jgi:HIT domain
MSRTRSPCHRGAEVIQRVAVTAREAFEPDGLNLLQANALAGWQSVLHFHIHVILDGRGTRSDLTGKNLGRTRARYRMPRHACEKTCIPVLVNRGSSGANVPAVTAGQTDHIP